MLPTKIWERDAFEALAFDVPPQSDTRSAGMGESEIHPAIFVEVKSDDADGERQIFFLEVNCGERCELAFARIEIDRCACGTTGEYEIYGAIVVEVGGDETRAGGVKI